MTPSVELSNIEVALFTRAQTGFAFGKFALTALARLDLADQIVKRPLELRRHGVERFRKASQLVQPAARHPDAQVPVRHRLCRMGHAPKRAVTIDAKAAPRTSESTSASANTIAERLPALRKPAK